jgi:hypothetical protein
MHAVLRQGWCWPLWLICESHDSRDGAICLFRVFPWAQVYCKPDDAFLQSGQGAPSFLMTLDGSSGALFQHTDFIKGCIITIDCAGVFAFCFCFLSDTEVLTPGLVAKQALFHVSHGHPSFFFLL